jgi:hypothetical protein|tara:strand:+ start:488 stop:673 length:186 start_codon:yes stop_codon:yes gene_type:complete
MVKLYAYGEAKPPARQQLWHEITEFFEAMRDYLTYSVLALLMRGGQIARVEKPTRHIVVTW